MNLAYFFASIGESFKNHYDSLSRMLDRGETPEFYTGSSAAEETLDPAAVAPLEDSVEISPEAREEAEESQTPKPTVGETDKTVSPQTSNMDDTDTTDVDDAPTPPAAGEIDSTTQPDGTYRFQQQSRLDYEMYLRFDLGAFTRTIESLAEGDTKSVEEFLAGGFGLNAELNFSGMSVSHVRDNTGDQPASAAVSRSRGLARGFQSSAYRAMADNFAVDAFTKEAFQIRRRAHNVINPAGHQLAVNKFSMRYSLDTTFSFLHLNRFNVQTRQVAEEMPESINNYITTAGQVAEKGTNEMMATFFDTVDSYLSQAEDRLLENAQAFMEAAAAELGFGEETMTTLEDQLTGSIESFFNRVDEAVGQLQAQYIPQAVEPAVEVEPTDVAVSPKEMYQPAETSEERTVAFA